MSKKRRGKKLSKVRVIKIIIIVAVILLLLFVALIFLRRSVSEKFGQNASEEILSATVSTGSISTTVYGSGRLIDDDTENITVPEGVEITDVKVSAGDQVQAGDILASVDSATVVSAMSAVQSEIDTLDEQLEDAADDEVSDTIKAQIKGRIKKIYAAAEDDVATVMYDNNALLILSLDGKMAVDVENETLSAGAAVTVTTSDGSAYTGEVAETYGKTATILLTDQGPVYGDTVTVTDGDGNEMGSGELYVHDPLTVVGYAGTIKSVYVSENEYVYAGSTLFTLSDTSYTAAYDTLLKERASLEETLVQLVSIYKAGAVCAEFEGTVKSVPDQEQTEDEESFTLSPDKTMSVTVNVDETNILSLSVGQEVRVEIDSMGEEIYEGTITEIDKTGTSSDGVTQYTANVQIQKQDGMLEGMSASANIMIESVDNALLIPADALNKTSAAFYVYTAYDEENGLGGMVEVTTGISNSSYVEIKDGLAEGDKVYYKDTQSSGWMNFSMPGGRNFGGDSSSGGSFPADMPSDGSFPSDMPSDGSFPSDMPSGGSFPSGGNSSSGGGKSSGGSSGSMPNRSE